MEFEHFNETYTIRRTPRYERPKLRGEGTTTQEPTVLLTMPMVHNSIALVTLKIGLKAY
ncbi:hypothetical protein MGH68_10855 [Erysipelothrix sp. D19-032]